jgi:hypothetical protein
MADFEIRNRAFIPCSNLAVASGPSLYSFTRSIIHLKAYQSAKPVTPHNNAEDEKRNATTQSSFVPNVTPRNPDEEKPDGGKKRTPLWEKLAVLIALGLLVVNIFQMRSTQKAATAAEKATVAAVEAKNVARDALVRSQRPWVGREGASYVIYESRTDAISLTFDFDVKNFGPSPALNVGYGLQPFVRSISEKPTLFQDMRRQACQFANAYAGVAGDSIFPGQISKWGTTGAFPVPGLKQGTRNILFYACIAYRDQFDTEHTTHHTTFCVFGPIAKPYSLVSCGEHDLAD